MKKNTKKSFLLMAVLACLLLVTTFSIGAYDDVDIIEVGQEWQGSWGSGSKYVYLTVDQTGYYDLDIEDRECTATLDVYFYDMDAADGDYSWSNTALYFSVEDGTWFSNNMYLKADHLYCFELRYGNYDSYWNYIEEYADVVMTVSANGYQPFQLTDGQPQNVTIGDQTTDWFEFTAPVSGNYQFKINQYSKLDLLVYEKESGEYITASYFNESLLTLLNLESGKEYIFIANSHEKNSKLVRISISKTSKDITKVDIAQGDTVLFATDGYFFSDSAYLTSDKIYSLDYKITYSDGTSEVLSYYECDYNLGLHISDVVYKGKIYSSSEGTFFKTGNQNVEVCYLNGQKSDSKVYITSFLQYFSYLSASSDYDRMIIKYENGTEATYYWKIKPSENNSYELYAYNWDQISTYITVFDKDNKTISNDDGYYLKAGEEYCLKITYYYKSGCTEDVPFTLEPYRKHSHNIDDTITPATLSKKGTITYSCTKCGYISSTETILAPTKISLSKTELTYNGKEQKPTVTVKDSNGKVLKEGSKNDYTVKYENSKSKTPGTYTVTVKFTGKKYTGSKTLTYTIIPKATSKISATQTTSTITLKWEKVTGAAGYRVYKYNSKKKKYEKLKDVTGTSLKISKLSAGTVYKYKVRAYTKNNALWGQYSSVFETATKAKTPTLKASSSKKGVASLSWSNVSGESGYQVYYATKKNGDYKKLDTYKANVVKASKSKLTSKKTYYFKVRAYTKTDSGTVYSAWSSIKSVKIK